MVAGVVPEDVVELDIIDLVRGLRLETLLNDQQFLLGDLHAEVVEDGAEAGAGDETTAATILILEVRLDQQAAVLHICAQALQSCEQNLFLLSV